MRSHTQLRTVAVAIAEHACRVLPPTRREWARAMCAEVESIDNDLDALLILRRQKEGSQKGAMHAVAERELGGTQLFVKLLREFGRALQFLRQQLVP